MKTFTEDKLECRECKRIFSSHLIQPLYMNEGVTWMCPLCARDKINEVHGWPKSRPFVGKTALQLWKEAAREAGMWTRRKK